MSIHDLPRGFCQTDGFWLQTCQELGSPAFFRGKIPTLCWLEIIFLWEKLFVPSFCWIQKLAEVRNFWMWGITACLSFPTVSSWLVSALINLSQALLHPPRLGFSAATSCPEADQHGECHKMKPLGITRGFFWGVFIHVRMTEERWEGWECSIEVSKHFVGTDTWGKAHRQHSGEQEQASSPIPQHNRSKLHSPSCCLLNHAHHSLQCQGVCVP